MGHEGSGPFGDRLEQAEAVDEEEVLAAELLLVRLNLKGMSQPLGSLW